MDFEKNKFILLGEYYLAKSEVHRTSFVKVSERLSLVYLLVSENQIKYIGKSVQGYRRPLNYHKNSVMNKVRQGIINECQEGRIVSVYGRSENLTLPFEGLELDLIEAYEQALIVKYSPLWNNYIKK